MKPRRGVDVPDCAERAGTMASRKGSETATLAPLRNVRRESDFFVMNMVVSLLLRLPHLKRSAFYYAENQGRKRVPVARCFPRHSTYRWSIIILQVASDRIHQQLFRNRRYK